MIDLCNLTKHYGEFQALGGISASIARGEVVGLLGPNGAGKTTAMKILVGYLLPSGGTARVAGIDVVEQPLEVQSKIGYLPENAPLYGDMLVQEYLRFMASMRGIPDDSADRNVAKAVDECGIRDVLGKPIGHLSKGYRQRVGLAASILHDPEILILDEPTTGLDPNQIVEVRDLIRQMGQRKTVILSTHILPEVEATCDRAVILIDGQIRADGTLAELTHSRDQVVRLRTRGPGRTPGGAGRHTRRRLDLRFIDADDGTMTYRLHLAPRCRPRRRRSPTDLRRGLAAPRTATGRQDAGAGLPRVDRDRDGGDGMNRIRSMARREFRSFFNSPIAYVFLLVFVGAALFTFFNLNAFFARGQADLRGLFESIPLLILLLVPALTMRLWAEEEKQGTIEILLTLPTRDHELVAGKFLASWYLLGIGLALTLPLAFLVAALGNLDWGPVIGGYLGALLLGAAYLAVGQFVSALTENQILAFILALFVCMVLWGLGTDAFTSLFPDRIAAVLLALGTGSRFESIARGVIDLRDLLYYVSLTLFFLMPQRRRTARQALGLRGVTMMANTRKQSSSSGADSSCWWR